jgi:hypothetical protein
MKEVQTLNRHANVTVSHGLFGPPIGVSNWGRPVIGDLWSANSFANQKLGSPGSVAIVLRFDLLLQSDCVWALVKESGVSC